MGCHIDFIFIVRHYICVEAIYCLFCPHPIVWSVLEDCLPSEQHDTYSTWERESNQTWFGWYLFAKRTIVPYSFIRWLVGSKKEQDNIDQVKMLSSVSAGGEGTIHKISPNNCTTFSMGWKYEICYGESCLLWRFWTEISLPNSASFSVKINASN